MSANKAAVPAASGYRAYSVLKQPIFAKTLITRFYAESISGNITSTDIIPTELRQCGDQVVFRRDPVAEIFTYHKNQDLEVSTLNTEPIVMVVNRSNYWNLKLDRVDEKQICGIQEWVKKYVNNVSQLNALKIDNEVFREMPLEASCHNKGTKAGMRTGAYNLGAITTPVTITPTNIFTYLTYLSAVLNEANIPQTGRFAVFPEVARSVFMQSNLLNNTCASGLNKAIVLGGMFPDIMGFTIYFSTTMPIYIDPSQPGLQCYLVVAGLKEATGFVTQLSESEVIDKDPRSFSKYWRGLMVYDFKVLRPEALAVLYATFTV